MNSPIVVDTSRRRQSIASTSTLVLVVLTVVTSPSMLSGCVAFTTPSTSTAYNELHLGPQNNIDVTYPHYGCLLNNKNNNQINCRSQNNVINVRRSGGVSLSMGIRSFIKRKILRKDKGDGESDGSQGEDVTLHSLLQSPGSAGLMESPLIDTDDTTNKDDDSDTTTSSSDGKKKSKRERIKEKIKQTSEIATTKSKNKYANDILTKNTNIEQESFEDTQERIKRMKTGGMTEEEKATFLNNALTRTLPKMKPKGPPIRQEIPGGDGVDGGKNTKRGSSSGSSAISGNDNLWNALTKKDDTQTKKESSSSSPPGEVSVASLMMDNKMKNEDAKRKYMESITNPDRFATFSTYQQTSATSTEDVDGDDEDDSEAEAVDELNVVEGGVEEEEDDENKVVEAVEDTGADFAQMKRQIEEDRALLNPNEKQEEQSAARDAVESILSMISSNNDKKKDAAAAATTDDNDDTTEGSDSSNKTKSTDHLAARLGKAAMEQEKRDAEARAAAEKKREEEKQAFAKLQKQREAEAERREMERMEKARKIAEEVRRKEEEAAAAQRAELEARQAAQDDYWAQKLKKEQARKQRSQPIDITRKKEVIARDSEERLEREVSEDVERAKIREEERAREDPHESEILKEAAEAKLRDRERVRDIEALSAAKASRTVPRKSNEDVSVSAFVLEQRKKKEEIDRLRKLDEQSLKSLNSPLPSPGKAPVGISPSPYRALDNLQPRPSSPAPVPVSSPPELSLSSLTMAKKSESVTPTPESPPPSPPPAPSQRLNLFEMTKLKEGGDSSARPAVKKNPPTKRVVRQQVPLSTRSSLGDDDDEDDDDEDLMRSGAPGLTVADALKQQRKKKGGGGSGSGPGGKDLSAEDKAKAWGIDMSKFK